MRWFSSFTDKLLDIGDVGDVGDVGDSSEGVARISCSSGCANFNAAGDAIISCLNGGKVLCVCDREIAEGSGVKVVVSDGVGVYCNCCS